MKNKSNFSLIIHPDLLAAQQVVYETLGFTCKNQTKESESEEYGAFTFEMGNQRIKYRVAKITPKKVGQFVTVWKRIGAGPILPYDMTDSIDLFIISVRNAEYFGQFVFPKALLCEKGIVSKDNKGGKRAMRVYPPWDIANNQQAVKTQTWQLKYFFEIAPNVDITRVRELLSNGV